MKLFYKILFYSLFFNFTYANLPIYGIDVHKKTYFGQSLKYKDSYSQTKILLLIVFQLYVNKKAAINPLNEEQIKDTLTALEKEAWKLKNIYEYEFEYKSNDKKSEDLNEKVLNSYKENLLKILKSIAERAYQLKSIVHNQPKEEEEIICKALKSLQSFINDLQYAEPVQNIYISSCCYKYVRFYKKQDLKHLDPFFLFVYRDKHLPRYFLISANIGYKIDYPQFIEIENDISIEKIVGNAKGEKDKENFLKFIRTIKALIELNVELNINFELKTDSALELFKKYKLIDEDEINSIKKDLTPSEVKNTTKELEIDTNTTVPNNSTKVTVNISLFNKAIQNILAKDIILQTFRIIYKEKAYTCFSLSEKSSPNAAAEDNDIYVGFNGQEIAFLDNELLKKDEQIY